MIKNKDRSKWFGASDTSFIMGNYDTATFKNWWLVKLGIINNTFTTRAMFIGSEKEHQILDSISSEIQKDKQVKIRKLRLRVNYDGTTNIQIMEVKTTALEQVTKALNNKQYFMQVQVQMYALRRKTAELRVYGLTAEDYKNIFLPVDKDRLFQVDIKRDDEFLAKYLIRLRYLVRCLKKRVIPTNEDYGRAI